MCKINGWSDTTLRSVKLVAPKCASKYISNLYILILLQRQFYLWMSWIKHPKLLALLNPDLWIWIRILGMAKYEALHWILKSDIFGGKAQGD